MLDFFHIEEIEKKSNREYTLTIKPEFDVNLRTKDLMIRGGDFYAVYDETTGLWSRDEQTVIDVVDGALKDHRNNLERPEKYDKITVKYMRRASSGSIDEWHKFVQRQMRDNFRPLDQKIMFSNSKPKRSDYASFVLPFPIEKGDISAYEESVNVWYDEENRQKAEWSFGAVLDGAAKRIQKFDVFYGPPKSGKSSLLDIFCNILTVNPDEQNESRKQTYVSTWNSKSIGSGKDFATDSFKNGPLLSVQHDGDLSRIEDNALLNSIVSHEMIGVNPKYAKMFEARFNTFLMLGTNKPVKITDAKSGLLRRLIVIKPTGKRISRRRYDQLKEQIKFEYGAIAYHCLHVFKALGETYYDDYVPLEMMEETNNFFNFMEFFYDEFKEKDHVTQTDAWKKYNEYCEFAGCYRMEWKSFGIELKNYFESYQDRARVNGVQVRRLYSGFKADRFVNENHVDNTDTGWCILSENESFFDKAYANWPAQYEKDYGKGGQPEVSWAKCKTCLCNLDASKVHYVKPPDDVPIVMVDFDLRDENGEKSLELNLEAANKWPKTYAELSKSGGGIHLYYIYEGDLSKVSRVYAPGIEIKVFNGNSAIRRKLTLCNRESITTISTGLPLKGDDKKNVNWTGYKNEKHLHDHLVREITKNINKGVHGDTTSSVHMIKKLLDDAYNSGIPYNVTELFKPVRDFAENSNNQAIHCLECVAEMHFRSDIEEDEIDRGDDSDDRKRIVLDTEIYPPDEKSENPGLFLICWKELGSPSDEIHAMVNPSPEEVRELFNYDIIGFNCRDYDNHMLYARSLGMSNAELYNMSDRIINGHDQNAKYGQAYNLSKWDVYEYCKASGKNQGLKAWEIELGKSHMEMGIPWDEPAPLDRWDDIIKYCKNDVEATEAVFLATVGFRMAREFQVALVKALHGDDISVTTNDTANTLSKRAIFGMNKNPQKEFNYRNLAEPVGSDRYEEYLVKFGPDYHFRVWNEEGLPEYRDYIPGEVLPQGWSILPFFPGYTFDPKAPKKSEMSTFHGDHGGEGGRNYSVRGIHVNVWDGDISSQYPTSIEQEVLFGPVYTKIYSDIKNARVAVKHKDFELAGSVLNGALKPYLSEDRAGDLAQGMKIIINAVYGLTKAGFINEFRDPKNVDNIVAKRGNLFMLVLKEQVEKRGYHVVHIKTDSIKIANATPEIAEFVTKFGKEYGYSFETEGEFTKFALLNDSAYVAYDKKNGWITKAAQFQEPYVKKTLFTKEKITFDDLCQTFNVKSALYLDMNEDLPDVSGIEAEYEKLKTDYQNGKVRKGYMNLYDMERTMNEIVDDIEDGHKYVFVGKVGRFCPIKDGCGGGKLYRIQDGKYYAAAGTSDYRWLEAEYVKEFGLEKNINTEYFTRLVDEAAADIGKLGDLEWFLNGDVDEPLPDFLNVPEGVDDEVPFDE